MIKSYGHFIKNTIEPMLDKAPDLLFLADSKGIPIDKNSASDFLERLFLSHMCTLAVKCLTQIIIAGIVCFTIYKVL